MQPVALPSVRRNPLSVARAAFAGTILLVAVIVGLLMLPVAAARRVIRNMLPEVRQDGVATLLVLEVAFWSVAAAAFVAFRLLAA